MKQLTIFEQKLLKAVHIIVAGVWITSVYLLLLFPLVIREFSSKDDLYLYIRIFYFIDLAILSPAALCTLITGLFYSLMTSWRFFKHGWIIYKWIVTVLIVAIGTIYLGPMVSKMRDIVALEGMLALQDQSYIRAQHIGLWAAIINSILLTVAMVVSVFKPLFKKKVVSHE